MRWLDLVALVSLILATLSASTASYALLTMTAKVGMGTFFGFGPIRVSRVISEYRKRYPQGRLASIWLSGVVLTFVSLGIVAISYGIVPR